LVPYEGGGGDGEGGGGGEVRVWREGLWREAAYPHN